MTPFSLRAMTNPNATGERFLAVAGGTLAMLEIIASAERLVQLGLLNK